MINIGLIQSASIGEKAQWRLHNQFEKKFLNKPIIPPTFAKDAGNCPASKE